MKLLSFYLTLLLLSLHEAAQFSCNDHLIHPNSREASLLNATESEYAYSVPLYEAASKDGAVCLDGSVPRYYFRPGDAGSKYFIYLAGGAWCSALTKHIACGWNSCQDRAVTSDGSTVADPTAFGPFMLLPSSTRQYFSSDPTINPLMYNWNVAYAVYCDGSSFGSDMSEPVETINDNNNELLYYRGHRVLSAIIDDLLMNRNMSNASDIVLGGCSSGGLSVYLHVDYVGELISEKHNKYVNSDYKFMGYADSGYFYDYESRGNFSDAMKYLYKSQNISLNGLNKGCLNANKGFEYNCMFAQNVVPYIKTKMFATQSQYDDWQIYCDLNNNNNNTLINEYGNDIATSFFSNFTRMFNNTNQMNNDHAGFLVSCRYHCGNYNTIEINGTGSGTAMKQFYYQNNTHNFWFQNSTYPCSSCCS